MRWPTKKRDDDRRAKKDCSWFVAVEKSAVITEVRGFGDPHFDKARCLPIIRKLLYLLNQGETFTKSEATALLTSAVNLYRFEDVHLRRMFYLIAKELCPIADEVAVVTSSLLKDIHDRNVTYQANAIRLLCYLTNGTSLSQVMGCLDEVRVYHNPMVQSAALVCAINLLKRDPGMHITHSDTLYALCADIHCSCAEIRYLCNTKNVRFHVAYLECLRNQLHFESWISRCMYSIGIERLLFPSLSSSSSPSLLEHCILACGISQSMQVYLKPWINTRRLSFSSLEHCVMARCIGQIARAKPMSVEHYPNHYKFLESCIYHKDELVAIEGFRALEELRDISSTELKPAIDVIRRIFRVSHKPVLRFAAFRALQKVAVAHREVWITPKDHVAIDLDANVYNLYMDEVNHRDKEAQDEQVSQVIKSQSFAIKEVSTHNLNLRRRLVPLGIVQDCT